MIALKVEVDNWRWHGVPFYLRSGKALAASRQTVTLGLPRCRRCGCSARASMDTRAGGSTRS